MDLSKYIPNGFTFGSSSFGLRGEHTTKNDFSVLFCKTACTVSFVSTKNTVIGEPVKKAREQFSPQKKYRGVVINVGQANVATGEKGRQTNEEIIRLSAEKLGVKPEEIFSASTGCIGEQIEREKIEHGMENNFPELSQNIEAFSEGIMSTDLVPKTAFSTLSTGQKILGVAKGSGMIEPNMGTMLAFVITDAKIDGETQQEIWKRVIEKSFNAVSVDSDTSTSDMGFLFSSGTCGEPDIKEFEEKLLEVCQNLAKKIARDGEGATKILQVNIKNADTLANAKILGKSVVNSPLWKSAVFGADPNWGRILMAIGKTQINFDPEKVSVSLLGTALYKKGKIENFDKEKTSNLIRENDEIIIDIDVQMGDENISIYGCDLSYKYVEINAEYHT